MTTLSDGLRQSDRVRFRMSVEASWVSSAGATITQNAETLLVSRNGGVLRLTEKLSMGQELHLRRSLDGDQWKNTRARVVAEIDQDPPNHFIYAVHILDPRADFWDIEFPAPHKAEEALARLLMECSFCQRREVVYLNELQLKSFEVRKCIARVCKDLSKGGLSFRSRNQYPEGTRLEVAVPFTPGTGAIFVPIRIVFSQAIPTAGLYRHGAAYIKPPLDVSTFRACCLCLSFLAHAAPVRPLHPPPTPSTLIAPHRRPSLP